MVRLKDEITILRRGELKHGNRGVRFPHLVPQACDLFPGKPALRFHGIVEDNDRHSRGKEALRYHPVEVLFVVCRKYEHSLIVTERHNGMTDQRIIAEHDDGLAGLFRRSVGRSLSVRGFPQKRNKCLLLVGRKTREQFLYCPAMDRDWIKDLHFRNRPGYLLLKPVEVGKPEIIRGNRRTFSFCFTGAFPGKDIGIELHKGRHFFPLPAVAFPLVGDAKCIHQNHLGIDTPDPASPSEERTTASVSNVNVPFVQLISSTIVSSTSFFNPLRASSRFSLPICTRVARSGMRFYSAFFMTPIACLRSSIVMAPVFTRTVPMRTLLSI